MTRSTHAELVLDARCELGEGPVWWHDALWFVDIEGRALHRLDPADQDHRVFATPGRMGFAVPTVDGTWLVAQDASVAVVHPGESEPKAVARLAPPEARIRMNDGKCDPAGRLYAGTMALDAAAEAGSLHRFDASGTGGLWAEPIVAPVTISNGLAWHEPSATMYYIDTPTRRIDAFHWNAVTGAISDRRPIATVSDGVPDGMCIDRDGMLWVAVWGGSRVACVDPNTGDEVGRVSLPCANVTSCCFGGESLDRLYVTTARAGLDDASLAAQPLAGGVFVAQVGAAGLPTTPCAAM